MRRSITALGLGVLPYADTDRPDEEDPEVQRIAKDFNVPASFVSDIAEETAIAIFNRTGMRPPLEDVLCAVEASGHEMIEAAKAKKTRAS